MLGLRPLALKTELGRVVQDQDRAFSSRYARLRSRDMSRQDDAFIDPSIVEKPIRRLRAYPNTEPSDMGIRMKGILSVFFSLHGGAHSVNGIELRRMAFT